MDDFDDFLKSVPVTPAKANDVRTAPTSSSDDALDDFFTDMGIPPKQSTSGTDGNLDQLLSEAVTPKQSESQQLPILKNDNIIYDKSNLEQLPSSASPDASRKVDIIRDSAIVTSDSLQIGKHAATVTPKLQSTTYNDDFDELFGDTTPVKVVDATQQIATPTVSDEKSLDLNVSKVPGDGVVINSTIPVVTPAKVSNTSELVTATYTTEFEELFGNTTPIAASGSVIGITATERKNSSVGVQLGNEIQTPVTAAPSTPSATSVKSAKKESTDDDLDFLSWLGDSTTPVKSPSSNTGTNPGARLVVPGDAPASLSDRAFKRSSSYSADSGLTTPTQAQSKVKALMDNFFDDLFGGISKAAPIIDQDAITKVKMSNADFERQVCEMINSSFIDVPTLRTFLREGGYIPSAYRGQVLCSLLTGDSSINEDPELEDTEGLSLLASKFNNHAGMISDCNIMTSISYCDESSSSRIRQDLQDIITLYCIRKEREYSSVLCSLLAPLLLAPNSFSKELSSSCFYCLVSDFVPLLSLQSSGIEAALRTVHSWLRLLVVYHSPAVAQHLDRTIPGWEKAASFTGIALVGTGDLKGEVCPGVDKEAAITSDTEIDAKEEGGTWTDKGSTKPESWGIPLQWICGLFSGSIPVENSSFLLDWALISQQRYAGVYLIAALLELYSGALVTMTGDDIRSWLQAISSGQKDWYTLLPLCLPHPLSVVEFSLTSPVVDWEEFTCGWAHAATVLQLSTPVAYQQALNNTEQWVASRSSKASTDPLGTRSNTSDSASNAPRESDNVALATDCDPENEASALSDDNMSPNTQTYVSDNNASVIGVKDDITDGSGTAQGKGLLDRMKILGTKMFTGTGANNSSNDNACGSHGYYKSKWAHESMLESDSMCLWSSPGEVVPFISSSSRTALPPFESIQYHFQEGVIAVRKSKTDESKESKEDEKENILKISRGKMTFPPLLQLCFSNSDVEDSLGESAPGVIYFGIDCRNERERTLGLFPRAYCIDPSFMTDTDQISKLLVTLEPLASSLHFCIIGAGEDFYEATYQPQKQGRLQELDTLSSVVADDRARLNAVAMFFLKRSFPHVSILDGGFVGAVRHLRESEPSLSLSNALADANMPVLEAVLNFNGGSVVSVPTPGVGVMSLAARFRQSVGEVNSNFQRAAISVGPIAASLIKVPPRISESLDDEKDDCEGDGLSLKLQNPTPTAEVDNEYVEGQADTEVPSLPPPQARQAVDDSSSDLSTSMSTATSTAATYFGGFGKKMSAFGVSSLETVRHNIAAAQLAHQQQQELIRQQQLQQPQQETSKQTGGVLWSSDIGSSSSSSSKGAAEGGVSMGMGFMGGLRSAIASKINTARGGPADDKVNVNFPNQSSGNTFVIDEEDEGEGEEDDGMGPRDLDPQKICISKTDTERAQALALHALAGLKKGDTISITRESLPGALLFPGIKYKERKAEVEVDKEVTSVSAVEPADDDPKQAVQEVDSGKIKTAIVKDEANTAHTDGDAPSAPSVKVAEVSEQKANISSSGDPSSIPSQSLIQVHRFLVVTRERFMVLDSGGSGIGSTAIVKSNHHLTELVKMTFRKSDPELICLYLGSEGKMRQYRMCKRKEFVEALQKNMQRFK